jgi:hypothetical protein
MKGFGGGGEEGKQEECVRAAAAAKEAGLHPLCLDQT